MGNKLVPVLVNVNESMLHLSHGKLLIESIVPTGKSNLYKSTPVEIILIDYDVKIESGDEYYDYYNKDQVVQICHYPRGLDEGCSKVITHQSELPDDYIKNFIISFNKQ